MAAFLLLGRTRPKRDPPMAGCGRHPSKRPEHVAVMDNAYREGRPGSRTRMHYQNWEFFRIASKAQGAAANQPDLLLRGVRRTGDDFVNVCAWQTPVKSARRLRRSSEAPGYPEQGRKFQETI